MNYPHLWLENSMVGATWCLLSPLNTLTYMIHSLPLILEFALTMNAISFEMREAPAYDEQAVLAEKRRKEEAKQQAATTGDAPSALNNWPVQLFLASPSSPVFHDCDLLVAADCTAYAYGSFHRDFIAGRSVVVACPKQREHDAAAKLTEIFRQNALRSVTLCRMFVPCCGGLEYAVYQALANCGKDIPLRVVTIGADGKILKTEG